MIPITFSWSIQNCISSFPNIQKTVIPIQHWPLTSRSTCIIGFGHVFVIHPTYHIWHLGLNMTGCVAYIHDLDTKLTFQLKVNLIGVMTCLAFKSHLFYPLTYKYYAWQMSVSPWYDVLGKSMTSVWPLASISKLYIFTMDLSLSYQMLVYGCITMRHYIVYILDFFWHWPLTYMWVYMAYMGVILVSFTFLI